MVGVKPVFGRAFLRPAASAYFKTRLSCFGDAVLTFDQGMKLNHHYFQRPARSNCLFNHEIFTTERSIIAAGYFDVRSGITEKFPSCFALWVPIPKNSSLTPSGRTRFLAG